MGFPNNDIIDNMTTIWQLGETCHFYKKKKKKKIDILLIFKS